MKKQELIVPHLNEYELTAKRLGTVQTLRFLDKDDIDAMYGAIFRILDKAKKDKLWAKGHITLTNKTTNEIIKEMKEK